MAKRLDRVSGYNPAENICWKSDWQHTRTCPACSTKDYAAASFGRCRSGRRWFWCSYDYSGWREFAEPKKQYGFVDTEDEAWAAAMDAVRGLRNGRPLRARVDHGSASRLLKRLNEAKRRTRPAPDSSDARVTEYLFGSSYSHSRSVRFRITKKTAKRIYYVRDRGEEIDERGEPVAHPWDTGFSDTRGIGYVDRQKLEADGEVYNRGVHWCRPDYHLHVSLERLLAQRYRPTEDVPDLAQLKAEMAAAHPDRGGTSAGFVEARARYVAARRAAARSERRAT
jgi:hypothetical protein